MDGISEVASEAALVGVALALGAEEITGWSRAELALVKTAARAEPSVVRAMMRAIDHGDDPLGERFCALRSPVQRRPSGATYTPLPIVRSMLAWAEAAGLPQRIVDPGTGSGRFIVNAGRRFANAELVAVELDPLASVLARAHLAAAGLAARAQVITGDYRDAKLEKHAGRTLFIGNPPYVRHHLVSETWKDWLTASAKRHGHRASQLAGLHVHFFLATAGFASPGDVGVFITAAEWLDVNYGQLLRELLLNGLGGSAVHVIEPTAAAFPDAATTAAITCFEVGSRPTSMRLRRVAALADLGELEGGRPVARERLVAAPRWSPLLSATKKVPEGMVELGELCRVHRGQVTGANDFWIAGEHSLGLPDRLLFPTVTRARELYAAGVSLTDASSLRRVIDLPDDLSGLPPEVRRRIEELLRKGRALGVDGGYIAKQRPCWWTVRLREPAPILATYMSRRPPAFVRNRCGARHINIAHGIYPRQPMTPEALDALAAHLMRTATLTGGRVYAGGLTKFEPREMERLLVPRPELLTT